MYDFSRFCVSVLAASVLATLFVGVAAWTFALFAESTRSWFPSVYHLQILGILAVAVGCVGTLTAAAALLLSDRMFSGANTFFLTAVGAAAGLAAIAMITPASDIHYYPVFAVAGAIGGWTFKQVWERTR